MYRVTKSNIIITGFSLAPFEYMKYYIDNTKFVTSKFLGLNNFFWISAEVRRVGKNTLVNMFCFKGLENYTYSLFFLLTHLFIYLVNFAQVK